MTDLDVATANLPTQAVLGDGYIDQAQTGNRPLSSPNLADDLTATESTTPSPYGSVAEGVESNQIMTDNVLGGPAALSRIDRDILDQPGITTVVLNEGLEDALAGRSATSLTTNGFTQLINYFQAYGITVIAYGLPPCDGYTGAGVTPSDACTSTVDTVRTTVNNFLAARPCFQNPCQAPSRFYIDPDAAVGVPDTAVTPNEQKLHARADAGDHVNLSSSGFATLTTAYLSPQDSWPLNDGADVVANDFASNNNNPYLINNPNTGASPLTLTGTTWTTDPARGTVLRFNGTNTDYAQTGGPTLSTIGSFTVAAWANLASTGHDATVISQDGAATSGFALQYDAADNKWAFTMPTSDTATPTLVRALSGGAPTTGTWTHLVGSYNAVTHTLSLYVNGALAGTATNTTPTNATGVFDLGRDQAGDYYPGAISDAQTWNYALTPAQVTALYQQVS